MTLNETMNEIADAIREKKGTSEKIAPINFAEEIKSISAGGESGGGGKGCYYIPYSALIEASGKLDGDLANMFGGAIIMYVAYAKVLLGNKYNIIGGLMASSSVDPTTTILGLSRDLRMGAEGTLLTLDEALQEFPQELLDVWQSLPKLTEEQFYDLNA